MGGSGGRDGAGRRRLGGQAQNDVIKKVKGEPGAGEFLLLDVRSRDAFAKAHIQGAFSAPLEELGGLTAQLPKDRELVTYCWSDT